MRLGYGVHMHDVVAMLARIVARAACPEAGDIANYRPAMLMQPSAIGRAEEILPLRDRHVRVHVDLALAQNKRRMRSLLAAGFRIRLPRAVSYTHLTLP